MPNQVFEAVHRGYIATQYSLDEVLKEVDSYLFDSTTKEEALSNIRSGLIKARTTLKDRLGVLSPEEQCLPRRAQLNDIDPDAA